MALKRCAHCRFLFEASKDVCPACKQPLDMKPVDERLEARPTLKRPPLRTK
jgi:hypothetical protein